jgi:4-amino-4-deoxy-L-arabinose transferase-like glycosyltransferase
MTVFRRETLTEAAPLALLGALAFAVRMPSLGQEGLWFDEAYTVLIADLPFDTALEALLIDGVHPPLYYLLMRAIILIGQSEFILRVPSVVFGAAAVPMLNILVTDQFGKRAGFLAGSMLLLSPFQIWHARDARMYSMLAFLATLVIFAFIRLWTSGRGNWKIVFVVASGLAYVTHYFALLLPLIQFVYLSLNIKRKPAFIRRWLPLQLLAAVPVLVWIALIATRDSQSFGIGWIAAPNIMDLVYTMINLTIGYSPELNLLQITTFIVVAAALIVGGIGLLKRPDHGTIWLLWGFLPLMLIFLLSLRRPLYIDRFFILSIPAILTVVALGVNSLPKRIIPTVTVIILGLFAVRGLQYFRDPLNQREQWREATELLAQASSTETIVFRVLQIAVPFRYYPPGNAEQQSMDINREITPLTDLADGFDAMWLVYWNANGDAHLPAGNLPFDGQGEHDRIAFQWISGQGPTISQRFDLKGITIFRFDLDALEQDMSS